MSRLASVAGAALAVGLIGPPGPAAACDSSGCLLATRGRGGLLAPGRWSVDVSFRGTEQDQRREGGGATDRVLRPKVDFESGLLLPAYHEELGGSEHFLQANVAYGLSSRATLFVTVPLVARRSYQVAHAPLLERYLTEGNGDALVGVRYGLGPSGLVAGLGVKTPTGRHRLISQNPGSEGILDPALQPGSGSFDVLLSLQYGRRAARLDWTASGSYQKASANGLGYRFGDEAIASLSAATPEWRRVGGSLQVKVFHKDRGRYTGEPVDSTGSTLVYLTPGVRVSAPWEASVYAYVQWAVHRYVNEAQLAPRLGYLVGVSRRF